MPRTGRRVGMFQCGFTPQGRLHLGNVRPYLVFDALRRWLEVAGEQVALVRGYDDLDPRIDHRAREAGLPVERVTEQLIDCFRADAGRLGIAAPTSEPRLSDHVNDVIALIRDLLDTGRAHVVGTAVDLSLGGQRGGSAFGSVDAGGDIRRVLCLTGQEWDHRRRVPLWQRNDPQNAGFESPWGRGVPSPHVSCVVLAHKYLSGAPDLHVGPKDIYEHHEMEALIGEAAYGAPYARRWLHSGLVTYDGVRMANSARNVVPVEDAARRHGASTLRFLYLAVRYRDDLDITAAALRTARTALDAWWKGLGELRNSLPHTSVSGLSDVKARAAEQRIIAALEDDFDTPTAQSTLVELVAGARKLDAGADGTARESVLAVARRYGDLVGLPLTPDPVSAPP